jgi:hypothetical protein
VGSCTGCSLNPLEAVAERVFGLNRQAKALTISSKAQPSWLLMSEFPYVLVGWIRKASEGRPRNNLPISAVIYLYKDSKKENHLYRFIFHPHATYMTQASMAIDYIPYAPTCTSLSNEGLREGSRGLN